MINSPDSIMPHDAPRVKAAAAEPFKCAHRYAQLGYPVFPVRPDRKDPATEHGLHDASTDPNTIDQWLRRNPRYNIGMCADDVLVLDVDVRMPEDASEDERAAAQEEFVALVQELFGDAYVPAGMPVVRTPNNGFHIYMRVDVDWAAEWGVGSTSISVGSKFKHIKQLDLKGCGRGYTLLPPSQVDGVQYRFTGAYTWILPKNDLAVMPSQVREVLEKLISEARPKPNNGNGHRPPNTGQLAVPVRAGGEHAAIDQLAAIWTPGRRQTLALAFAGAARKSGIPELDVEEIIASVCDQTGDTELQKRIDAVRCTYAKPIQAIAGWSLLTDSERATVAYTLGMIAPFGAVTTQPEQRIILQAIASQLGWFDARYNEATHSIEICERGTWRPLTDGDIAELTFVHASFINPEGREQRIRIGKERANDAVTAYAHRNKFDPIADLLLNQLPPWDGRDRIAELAAHIIHSMPTLPNGADPVETFLRKWLVGAVARALVGEQNFVIILIGSQGIGKSQLARWLAPKPDLFSDAPIDPDSRESVVLAGRVLVHELAELGSTTRRKDVDALKRFLSASTTDVRLPYARTSTCIRHRASYLATANDAEHLLRDSTGNRRFVALRIDSIDWAYAQIDKQQLWAQAVALYRAGWDYHLTDQEKEYQTQTNAKHEALRSGSIGDIMLELLDNVEELTRPQTIPLQAIHLLPPEPLAQEYLRMIGAEDGSMAAVAPIGVVSPTGEIAIWASQLANLAARVIRGGDANRYLQEINALVSRAGGRISERREINGVRRRCAVLSIEQAQALMDYLS